VATILNEVARASEVAVVVDERAVRCDPRCAGGRIWASDPLYVACEAGWWRGRPGGADAALAALRAHPLGAEGRDHRAVKADPPTLCCQDRVAAPASSTC